MLSILTSLALLHPHRLWHGALQTGRARCQQLVLRRDRPGRSGETLQPACGWELPRSSPRWKVTTCLSGPAVAILLGRWGGSGSLRVRTPRRSAHHSPCYVLQPGLQCGRIGILGLHARLPIRLRVRPAWQANGKHPPSKGSTRAYLCVGCAVQGLLQPPNKVRELGLELGIVAVAWPAGEEVEDCIPTKDGSAQSRKRKERSTQAGLIASVCQCQVMALIEICSACGWHAVCSARQAGKTHYFV